LSTDLFLALSLSLRNFTEASVVEEQRLQTSRREMLGILLHPEVNLPPNVTPN
jgi:hypothetical protein